MSLKSNLNQIIKDRNGGIFTLAELEDYCHKYPAKISQAERRLRPSDSPSVESVWNEKRTAIIGYRWKMDSLNDPQAPQKEQTDIPLTILGTNIPYNLKQ